MSIENIVNVRISDEDKAAVEAAIATLEDKLGPYLIALTPDQRRKFPKVKNKTLPFVQKVTDYIRFAPEFIPNFMKIEEFTTDFDAYQLLQNMQRRMQQLVSGLDVTILLSGSEAYKAALSYYNAVKQAAKMNVSNAREIQEELSKRFAR